EQGLDEHLGGLHEELRTDRYRPLPVKRVEIPKAGKPGEKRPLGIPAVYDRVCQQALLNRLEPIFEPLFDDSSFGSPRLPGVDVPGVDGDGPTSPSPAWARGTDGWLRHRSAIGP